MRYLIVKQTDRLLNHAWSSQIVQCNSYDDKVVVPGEITFIAEKRVGKLQYGEKENGI